MPRALSALRWSSEHGAGRATTSVPVRRSPTSSAGAVRLDLVVAVTLFALTPLAAWHATNVVRDREDRRARDALALVLERQSDSLQEQMAGLTEALSGVRDLFDASQEVTRSEFELFAGRVLTRHPGVRSLGWAPRVPPAQREAHEALMRSQGLTTYRVRPEGGSPTGVAPPLSAPDLLPLAYVEPAEVAPDLLGQDLTQVPGLGDALSDCLRVHVPAPGEPGTLAYLPATTGPGFPLVLAVGGGYPGPRQEGVLWAAVSLRAVMEAARARSHLAAETAVSFQLRRRHASGAAALVLADPVSRGDEDEAALSLVHTLSAPTMGWELWALASEDFIRARRVLSPGVWGAGAAVVWAMMAYGLLIVGRTIRRQDALRRVTEEMFVLDSLAEGVVVADAAGRIVRTNDAARRILGPVPDDGDACRWMAKAGLVDAVTGALCAAEHEPLTRALRGVRVDELTCLRPATADAGRAWISGAARPLSAPDGRASGAVLVLRDITARQQAADERERLSRAIAQTADAVVITDRKGVIEYVNPAFEAMTGYTLQEARGQTPRLLRSGEHPPEFYARLWRTILAGEVFRGAMTNRRKDGRTYAAEQTISCIRGAGGEVTHFISVSKDMTTHNRLRRREVEFELAAAVQRRLFPRACPPVPGLEVAGRAVPAEETSGDTYDFVARPDGALLLVVGDVAGHGVGPALLMSEVHAYVRSLAALPLTLPQILGRVNTLLRPDLPDDSFVSLMLVEVDPRTRRLTWANAGHVPGLVLGPGGAIAGTLEPTGPALGLREAPVYRLAEEPALPPTHVLLLATDGATECRQTDGTRLEDVGLAALASDLVGRPAQAILDELHRRIALLTLGQTARDDVTLVVVKAAVPADATAPEP